METLTLVKAGIRNRKGIFFGFVFLTMIITVSLITIIGVKKNYCRALENVYKTYDMGEAVGTFNAYKYTEEDLIDRFGKSDLVDSLEIYDCIMGYDIKCGDNSDGNSQIIMKPVPNLQYFNDDMTELMDESKVEPLKKGEILVPYGLHNRIGAEIGDEYKINFYDGSGERTFIIKGFVEEPYLGSSNIGWKMVYLGDEDFDEIYDAVVDANMKKLEDEDDDTRVGWYGHNVFVHPSEMAYEKYAKEETIVDKIESKLFGLDETIPKMSINKFIRELNRETGFNDLSANAISREDSEKYTGIFMNIILAVIEGVVVLLLFIFLIVVGHNLSTELEIDYENLGILKSQGFTDRIIRRIYTLEYLIVEGAGIIVGIIVSIPVERWLSGVFFQLTAILPEAHIPIVEAILVGLILFAVTSVYIFIFTRKINKATPVKAITNSKEDVYFSNRLNAPITKRFLGMSIGLRQITSAPKKYISIVLVTSLLIFTAITIELMSDFIVSKYALKSMGEPYTELNLYYKEYMPDETIDEIEDIVEKYATIESRIYRIHTYVSINGENVMSQIRAFPEDDTSVYKGRDIKYDNEVVITESVAELMELNIGDTVTLTFGDMEAEYVVVGIFQTLNDLGKAIGISLDGYSRIRTDREKPFIVNDLGNFGMELSAKDGSEFTDEIGEKIEKELTDKYGDKISVSYQSFGSSMDNVVDNFYIAAEASKYMIYVLTFIFALVTVLMVCAKAFIQERIDIGVERAIGFTVGSVRRQFAARFMLVSLISSIFGCVLGRLLSRKVLESLFSLFGIPHMEMRYDITAFIMPVLLFALCYMLFGYLASRKVKKFSARELISE